MRDAAAYRETMVFEENVSAVDPMIESSEQLHNEWVEPVGVPSTADWSAGPTGPAAPAGVAQGRQGLVASPGWWPGPSWKKEDGIMSSIAEGDENSETLGLKMPELGRNWQVKEYMCIKTMLCKRLRFFLPISPLLKNFRIQYIGIIFSGGSELNFTVKVF